MPATASQSNRLLALRDWVTRTPARFYLVFVVLAALPVALFFLFADRALRQETETRTFAENQQVAQLSAHFLEDHFGQQQALLQAYATDPSFKQAWNERDMLQIDGDVAMAHGLQPDSSLISVYELDGTMRAIAPYDPALLGRNFAFRDWYKGVTRNWTPYVSEVYRTQAEPQQLSVAVSVPIKDEQGRPIGIIAAAYSLDRVSSWLKQMGGSSVEISVVDQNGNLLAHPNIDVFAPPISLAQYEPVQKALSGQSGQGFFTRNGQTYLVTYLPIAGLHWGILAEQPITAVQARVAGARKQVGAFAFAFALLALLCGSLLSSFARNQQTLNERVKVLAESELRYRSLIEGANYGIYRSSERGFVAVNPAMVKMLDYETAEQVLALDMAQDIYADPQQRERLIAHSRKAGRVEPVELQWKRRNGTLFTVRLSGRVVRDEQNQEIGYEMIAEDVTERRALERQLQQSQKMEAIGRLAGGIAHDFNNLLTVITGYTQMAIESLGADHPLYSDLKEVRSAAERAAALTRQLLAFSRQQVLEPRIINLTQVVHEMENMLRRLIGDDVELKTALDPSLSNVKADPSQIGQVVMNLAINARDAMTGGGQLLIETRNEKVEAASRRHPQIVKDGEYALLLVSDNGSGMDAETVSKIFDPFFTTKPQGKGTGLGLSTVYGIVKQSGGYIWVESELGIGTTFKVYLPVAAEPAPTASQKIEAVREHAGSGTILLVEDEEGLRTLARGVLQRAGYRVLDARNGVEALKLCKELDGKLDLLLTDVVMQQMSGRELTDRLVAIHPEVRVLFMSGYTGDAMVEHGVEIGAATFLQKPFTTQTLVQKVREALEMPAPARASGHRA